MTAPPDLAAAPAPTASAPPTVAPPVVGTPLAPSVRVLVKGASTVNWVSWMGGPRVDLAYPRVVESVLLASGRPAVVRDTSLAAQHPSAALRTWQQEVVTWSPDVVVLHYGHMECIHQFLPVSLQRHAQSLRTRPGPVRDAYREHVAGPGWKGLARLQQQVGRRVPATAFGHRRRTALADLARVVERVRSVGSPLVLVMGLLPPGGTYASWFPGIGERIEEMDAGLAALVADVGRPDVRLFPTRSVLAGRDADDVTPDGAHLAPWAHRAVGEALAAEIGAWAAEQPHLRAETFRPPPR